MMSENGDDQVQSAVDENHVLKEVKDCAENPPMFSPQLQEEEVQPQLLLFQEEEVIKKRYGGILPKKKPLISKDHEHAFFDSADWALGKQGQGAHNNNNNNKPKAPAEALRPKLEPTRQQQQLRSRRSAYAPDHQSDCDCDSDSDGTYLFDGGGNHPSQNLNNIPVAADDNNTHTDAHA